MKMRNSTARYLLTGFECIRKKMRNIFFGEDMVSGYNTNFQDLGT